MERPPSGFQPGEAHASGVPAVDVRLVCGFLPVDLSRQSVSTNDVECPRCYCFGIDLPQDDAEELRDGIICRHGAGSP